jgi:hypothetical protein
MRRLLYLGAMIAFVMIAPGTAHGKSFVLAGNVEKTGKTPRR